MKPVNVSTLNVDGLQVTYDPLADLAAAAESSFAELNVVSFSEISDLPATITYSPCSYRDTICV